MFQQISWMNRTVLVETLNIILLSYGLYIEGPSNWSSL